MSQPVKNAMLLAAGAASRLGAIAETIPKPMLMVGGRPLIEHTVRQLAAYGVEKVVVNLQRHGEVLEKHFGDGAPYGVRMRYWYESELLGTAGGVKKCEAFLRDGTFLVQYGDNLSTCNLEKLVACHRSRAATATVALFWRDDVSAHSAVEVGPDQRIVKFVEKPSPEESSSHWISAGVLVLEPRVLDVIPADRPSDFGFDIFPRLLCDGEAVYGYYMTGDEGLWWIDTPERYHSVAERWKHGFPDA